MGLFTGPLGGVGTGLATYAFCQSVENAAQIAAETSEEIKNSYANGDDVEGEMIRKQYFTPQDGQPPQALKSASSIAESAPGTSLQAGDFMIDQGLSGITNVTGDDTLENAKKTYDIGKAIYELRTEAYRDNDSKELPSTVKDYSNITNPMRYIPEAAEVDRYKLENYKK